MTTIAELTLALSSGDPQRAGEMIDGSIASLLELRTQLQGYESESELQFLVRLHTTGVWRAAEQAVHVYRRANLVTLRSRVERIGAAMQALRGIHI